MIYWAGAPKSGSQTGFPAPPDPFATVGFRAF